MGADVERYFELLRKGMEELGKGGGLAAASIYDTAQVLRFAPDEDVERRRTVIKWLLEQQQVQGAGTAKGWGKPGVSPLAQSVPTMAALLALHERKADCSPEQLKRVEQAVEQGRMFMRQNAEEWAKANPLPDDIPVAVELILPMLLDDAREWHLPEEPFAALRALGQKRRGLIARFNPGPESTAAHAWEAWGHEPEERWLMDLGQDRKAVGHSPSATAFWLKRRQEKYGDGAQFARRIQNYLADCTKSTQSNDLATGKPSTQTGVPGTYPTCFPIDRWEQLWSLLSLYETRLLADPGLKDVVEKQLADVGEALKKKADGIGLSDYFVSDGDDTAAALTVLLATKKEDADLRQRAEALQKRFERNGQFTTYPHELQPSLTTTAHWMLVLELLGKDMSASLQLVEAAQEDDSSSWTGLWLVDKWNCSWLYATSQSIIALAAHPGSDEVLRKAMDRLIELQDSDGSWGASRATSTETAFGARSLLSLRTRPAFEAVFTQEGPATRALQKAAQWLAAHVDAPDEQRGATYWIDKEPFATPRLDRTYELSSLIALKLAGY